VGHAADITFAASLDAAGVEREMSEMTTMIFSEATA
jgi:hypothetical protein